MPSALIQLVEHGQLERHNYDRLRWMLVCGRGFPCKYLRRLVQQIPHATYSNLYGPTETNVCTYYHVQSSDVAPDRTEPVPIGKACANTEVFALDRPGQGGAAGSGRRTVRPQFDGHERLLGKARLDGCHGAAESP